MGKTVLLRHELRDGSSHYDWMIQRAGAGEDVESPLITLRVMQRIDRFGGGENVDFLAERIGDHRAAYLTYEGEIGGGRGRVERVAQGEVEILVDKEGELVVRGWLGESQGVFRGRVSGAGWGFRFSRA